jgi:hypothetical protein
MLSKKRFDSVKIYKTYKIRLKTRKPVKSVKTGQTRLKPVQLVKTSKIKPIAQV